jgi:hypothetical protein
MGAIMRDKWTVAPWMRRRIARHLRRGTSERVIACLIKSAATPPVQTPRDADIVDWQDGTVDLTNVIPFRKVRGAHAQPAPTAHRRTRFEPLIESN